jgi:hypothetical protein
VLGQHLVRTGYDPGCSLRDGEVRRSDAECGRPTQLQHSPRLQAQFRFDWLHLEVSDLTGALTLGVTYDHLDVRARYKENTGGWQVQNTWNTVFMYGAL